MHGYAVFPGVLGSPKPTTFQYLEDLQVSAHSRAYNKVSHSYDMPDSERNALDLVLKYPQCDGEVLAWIESAAVLRLRQVRTVHAQDIGRCIGT